MTMVDFALIQCYLHSVIQAKCGVVSALFLKSSADTDAKIPYLVSAPLLSTNQITDVVCSKWWYCHVSCHL